MLCGIYCAAHLIGCYAVAERANRKTQKAIYESNARIAFLNLLESLEKQRLLRARKIACENVGGFSDRQIAKVFNGLTARRRRNLFAVTFTDPLIRNLRNSERRELIFDIGACAIVQEDGSRHWITAEGRHRDGGYACFDPELPDPITRRERLGWERVY
jgi:hypothetical protein